MIARIKRYTADGEAAFKADAKTQDAVLHNLEIIGQCIKDYGIDDLIGLNPSLPWAQIAAFRNVLAHKYLGVDMALVWEIVVRELPLLEAAIIRMVDDGRMTSPTAPEKR